MILIITTRSIYENGTVARYLLLLLRTAYADNTDGTFTETVENTYVVNLQNNNGHVYNGIATKLAMARSQSM